MCVRACVRVCVSVCVCMCMCVYCRYLRACAYPKMLKEVYMYMNENVHVGSKKNEMVN